MEVIPAVDIMKGNVVRLLKGDPGKIKSYEHLGDPVAFVRRWKAEGARIVHVIDLDAALGFGNNVKVIEAILHAVKVPVQVGGGIRNLDMARTFLNKGIERVMLGSLAFKQPSIIKTLLGEFGENRVIIALDNLKGLVRVNGWKTSTNVTVDDAVGEFLRLGVKFFLVTSVERDGTLSGPDAETLSRLCRQGIYLIAAGGIGSLDDLVLLKGIGVYGVVVGKALYEGSFSLGEAIRVADGKER